jgi:hypothetical protein
MEKLLKRPSDEVLSQLADIASVPREKEARDLFSRFIVHMLLPDLHSFCNRPKNRPNNQAVREAVQAMYSVLRAINNLSTKDRELLVDSYLEYGIYRFLMYADDHVVKFEDGHIAEQLRPPGRPKGRRGNKNLGLAQLVSDLIYIADKVGGKLTCEKNIGQGTLIDAIDVLEPFLPPSVVQQDRSPSTIDDMRSAAYKRLDEDRTAFARKMEGLRVVRMLDLKDILDWIAPVAESD